MRKTTIMLATKEHLKQIYESAVNSVKPDSLIKNFIRFSDNCLIVKSYTSDSDKTFSLKNRDVYIIGAGKAVLKMCDEFLRQLSMNNNISASLKGGILSIPFGTNYDFSLLNKYNISYNFGANNNIPDQSSEKCTQDIVGLIRKIKNSNENHLEIPLIITFISGGGSALLSLPKLGITLQQKCVLIADLVKKGANINELNSVRQCISEVKGGKLAKLAVSPPNRLEILSFIISDIINDPIELIASGPTVIDNSHVKRGLHALSILNKYSVKIDNVIREKILSEDLEVNSQQSVINLITNIVIGNNTIALNAGKETAAFCGYKVIYLGNQIEGEAKDIATNLCEIGINFQENDHDFEKYRGICWIGGGETTVNMDKCNDKLGIGGRCQEMGLAFCHHLNERNYFGNLLFLAAGTDGQDGPTKMAGVIVDSLDTKLKSRDISQDLFNDLKNHNSHNFFLKHFPDWFVDTGGVTGTNVMDIYCMIKYFNK